MARRKFKRAPDKLPQHDEIWHVLTHHLRVWITPEFEEPYRPYVVLALNLEQDILQCMELVEEKPTPEQISQILTKAMQKPPLSTGQKAHRPTRIQIENADWLAPLKSEFGKLEIGVQQYPRTEQLNIIVADLEQHMRSQSPEFPGLLSVKGVTPAFLETLLAAAAEFYRLAPWVYFDDRHPFAIWLESKKETRYFHVMGNAGMEYGLAMYRRWSDVERMYTFVDDPMEKLPEDGGNSFFFSPVHEIPVDDWDAIEQYGWDVADDEQAYPFPMRFLRYDKPQRPPLEDLQWYEAVLRAVPIFLQEHFLPRENDPPSAADPLTATITVETHDGPQDVSITLPGGELSTIDFPAGAEDWPDDDDETADELAFDRRGMEGAMRMFGSGFDDPALNEAQDLMYQAFEEKNPAKRIILAHEALEISPDCADAYVLLAEEEADTVGRALEYYQKAVEAGERALGEDYFEENEGHFWGLLETRPYMRARQGLAEILWRLDKTEDAMAHYRDMLRLNPDDNQGIRYSLLNLLVHNNQDGEAMDLIDEYEDDAMAEWLYTNALLVFRAEGAGSEANRRLREALEQNSHVPDYLTGQKRLPIKRPPYMSWGGEDEAVHYAAGYLDAWRKTPGALDWLKSQHKSGSKKKKR